MFFFSFSILSLKTVVFIRFRDHSLHSIDLTGCCILEEERIILSIALCSGGVLSLRIALSVPQPRLTKKPSFSKPKNNFSYNNNKNKDKNMGNEMFCFVCRRTNHLAKTCFQRRRQPVSNSKPEANTITMGVASDFPSERYHVKRLVYRL